MSESPVRRHAWLLVLAAVVGLGKASENPRSERGDFELPIRARFLEPGRSTGMNPIYVRFSNRSPESVSGRAYAWFAPVEFEASADLARLKTTPVIHDKRLPAWDLWRHRHGYTYGIAREPVWNTLGDEPRLMNPADADFYDAYLVALYRMWLRRELKTRILSAQPPPEPPPAQSQSLVSIPLQYDETGLAEPVSGSFLMHQWHVPVRVGFTLMPSSSTHPADWWFEVRGDAFVRYDEDEWRRRHGYRKTLFGYRWDSDFPGGQSLTPEDGRRLDLLMERGIQFWAEAALNMGLFELDRQLKDASRIFAARRYPSTQRAGPPG
jgi:hypothetical protein